MASPETDVKRLKREVLVRLIKAFYSDDFAENTRLIPYTMTPKGSRAVYRCCIFKERVVLRARVMAGLGLSIEDDDETVSLSLYAKIAGERIRPNTEAPLTMIDIACQGCPDSRIYVTELCQNCVAKPCVNICKFGAIHIVNNRSVIDQDHCKKCKMCISSCPYGAIMKTVVPCESVCPVGAMHKDQNGLAVIDFDSCISCGKCVDACPFGSAQARSQIIDVLSAIRSGRKVIAMVAPAVFGQFPCSPQQLNTAIKQIGFSEVYEVAQGADITAAHEAKDFAERMERGDKFMTTSCCAAYNELVAKHLPEMRRFVSDTHTPMRYTAEIVRREHPDAVTVFFSPCFAKRREAALDDKVDLLLTIEELGAIFIALNTKVDVCAEENFVYQASKEARDFAITGRVARSVQAACTGDPAAIKPVVVNSLNKQAIRELKQYAKIGQCESGNLIEVMACEGGCIGGNATLNSLKIAEKQISAYSSKSRELTPQG